MEVLSNPEVTDIITWLPHGKGFIILQKRRFSMDVMPLYFKHSKFTSFTRKLNRWGFTRVSRGPEMGAYYHKVRDEDGLCKLHLSILCLITMLYPCAVLPTRQLYLMYANALSVDEQVFFVAYFCVVQEGWYFQED